MKNKNKIPEIAVPSQSSLILKMNQVIILLSVHLHIISHLVMVSERNAVAARYGESYKNMETTWEWIASEVRKLGYPNLAEMALVIDRHIAELYGKGKVTEYWSTIYDEICNIPSTSQPELIWEIIHESFFCYACKDSAVHKLACVDCKYGKKYGVCYDKKSELCVFCRIFNTIFWVE